MASPSVVPLTVTSPLATNYYCAVAIGEQSYGPPSVTAGYWLVVVDRVTLNVVYNQVLTSYTAAPNLGSYNTDGYFMVFTTIAGTINTLPQGDLYNFLIANGAGKQLSRLEQINDQIGCGAISGFGYSLISVLGLGANPPPGIEVSTVDTSNLQGVIVTASLIGTVVDGQTIYSPVILQ
ncbi:MAG TPA: hypothetical protein VJ696_09225 [Rhodanobacteraceae bacterium]|nr:hypothetical protein [Rhodanobacteraceae bacterium]